MIYKSLPGLISLVGQLAGRGHDEAERALVRLHLRPQLLSRYELLLFCSRRLSLPQRGSVSAQRIVTFLSRYEHEVFANLKDTF